MDKAVKVQDEPEYLVLKASHYSKNDEEMSKVQRGQLKEVPTIQGRKNMNIKIYYDRDRS